MQQPCRADSFATTRGIPVEPPQDLSVAHKQKAGLSFMDVKSGLQALKVVAYSEYRLPAGTAQSCYPGQTAYVPNEALANARWAREVFDIGGTKFIVVPLEFITAISG